MTDEKILTTPVKDFRLSSEDHRTLEYHHWQNENINKVYSDIDNKIEKLRAEIEDWTNFLKRLSKAKEEL